LEHTGRFQSLCARGLDLGGGALAFDELDLDPIHVVGAHPTFESFTE
jgi:hypothetical protein